ncbi:hypothetical protein BGX34_006176 [Mortierella sp. NVP85]|nr:hypothetical protein BGX34_006176 [Mortierella sp. NVP85]
MSELKETTATSVNSAPVSHSGTERTEDPSLSQGHRLADSIASENHTTSNPTTALTSSSEKTAEESSSTTAVDSVAESLSKLDVGDPVSASKSEVATTTTTITTTDQKTDAPKEPEEELSPEEAQLRAKGLKSTHRPGFYIHVDSPRRLRIQTKDKAFDVDRYCPHANADMLKWGVLRSDMTLRCGVHYWGFDLTKNGQCIAHPDETLNACPVADPGLEW